MLFLCRGGCISRHGGLLSAKSVCACSGETLLGTSLGKTYLSIVLKATSLYDRAEGTGAKEEGHESTGAHEGALQGMLNAAQMNLLDMGERQCQGTAALWHSSLEFMQVWDQDFWLPGFAFPVNVLG